MSLPSRCLLRIIRFYQAFSGYAAPRCRFWPTCSEYSVEAIQRYGAGRGSWLAAKRLSRCRPFGPHGYDPVPLWVKARATFPSRWGSGTAMAGTSPASGDDG